MDAGRPSGVISRDAVLGVLSLILWALIIVVTCKYVLILLRADNDTKAGALLAGRALHAWRSAPAPQPMITF